MIDKTKVGARIVADARLYRNLSFHMWQGSLYTDRIALKAFLWWSKTLDRYMDIWPECFPKPERGCKQ